MLKTHLSVHAAIALMLTLSACSTARQTGSESTRHITATMKTVSEPETIGIRLPVYNLRHTVNDSASTLQTPVALSEARINPDGSLSHSLSTADTVFRVPVLSTTVSTESSDWEYHKTQQINRISPTASAWLKCILVGIVMIVLMKKCR